MKMFELPCMDRRKSFYGKALVIEEENGTKKLFSYNTLVAEIDPDGNFTKVWSGNTQTTNRHIKSFKLFYNMEV